MAKKVDPKSQKAVNIAQRKGLEIETAKKYSGGSNKQHVMTLNTARLDRETEELKHETVSMDFGRTLQQARTAKGLTQKDLATKINEKPQVVNDYEAGRAIPNQVVINKLERAVGIKLRGKDMGQPLSGPKKK